MKSFSFHFILFYVIYPSFQSPSTSSGSLHSGTCFSLLPLKKNIIIGLLIVLALVAYIKKDFIIEKSKNLFSGVGQQEEVLTVVLNEQATDISPYSLNLNNLIRTANIYQGLVAFDKNLKIIPALAVSWGNINPTTWEFKLRKGVIFHDGTPFTSQDVVDSYNSALSAPAGQVKTYLNTVSEIKIIDSHNIQVVTKKPDPLLLSKFTKFLIHKPDNIGTGPYKIREWVPGYTLDLVAFSDYWGGIPAFQNAEYIVTKNKAQREKDFEEEKTDILVAVPQEKALELPKEQVKTGYGLEVNFLMFKMDDELFSKREIREAVATLFDPEQIEAIGNYFVRQATQFVAPGVFGYNTNIPRYEYSEEKQAKDIFESRLERISYDYLLSYRTLSEYIMKQLKDAGFSIKDNAISPDELLEKIRNNKSQLFLVGWQAEDGDAQGFLDAFIHSEGEFNGGRYKNIYLDNLIEKSREEMDPQKRLTMLQEVMKKIHEELIGIPLFESSRLYAVQRDISWEPRLDGLVLASEVE